MAFVDDDQGDDGTGGMWTEAVAWKKVGKLPPKEQEKLALKEKREELEKQIKNHESHRKRLEPENSQLLTLVKEGQAELTASRQECLLEEKKIADMRGQQGMGMSLQHKPTASTSSSGSIAANPWEARKKHVDQHRLHHDEIEKAQAKVAYWRKKLAEVEAERKLERKGESSELERVRRDIQKKKEKVREIKELEEKLRLKIEE